MDLITTILCFGKPGAHDLAFAKLSDFMGVKSEILKIRNDNLETDSIQHRIEKGISCLALSGITLKKLFQEENCHEWIPLLTNKPLFLFVYDLLPLVGISKALSKLTDGTISSILSFEHNKFQFEVSEYSKDICREFSGMKFGPINREYDFRFKIGNDRNNAKSLISIFGDPFFIRVINGSTEMFFLANGEVLDIDLEVSDKLDTAKYFSRLVPELMFLKHVFGVSCWHNQFNQACIIVDDPLLKQRYGFLNYQTLLEAMEKQNFFTDIAFIPWNYKRTSKGVASLINKNKNRFSISLHGNDHTRYECGIMNYDELNSKIKLAMKRMEALKEKTGLNFNRVMVIPYGRFSTNFLEVLKSNNLIASVGTDLFANNSEKGLTVRDLLEPAILRYSNFPLFLRRHLDEEVNFVFDLFLGKPLLIVAHHSDFRDDYKAVINKVEFINSIDSDIHWKGLEDIVKKSYLIKKVDKESYEIKIFSRDADILNKSNGVRKYIVLKRETGNIPVSAVNINGEEVKYELKNGLINLEVEIFPKENCTVEIIYKDILPEHKTNPYFFGEMKIFFKRNLSEFRDNYLSKNEYLFDLFQKLTHFYYKRFNKN